jgi:hypothetical protein
MSHTPPPDAIVEKLHALAAPSLQSWLATHRADVLRRVARAQQRAALTVHGRGERPEASAPTTYGGTSLVPGVWLYGQFPGSHDADAIQLVAQDEHGGWKALRHGGVTPYHISKPRLRDLEGKPLVPGNYLKQLGYLEHVFPDVAQRSHFVASAQRTPAREQAARDAEERRKQEALSKHGPWFADVAGEVGREAGGTLSYVGAGWVLKKVLAKHGVTVKTGQRHYSMASGMDFSHAREDAARINKVFPYLASERGNDSAHPFAHEDRSDSMTDYYSPGGFRVAPAYVAEVKKAILAEIEKRGAQEKKAAAKPPAAPRVYQSDWRPTDILVRGDGSNLWVYDVGKGIKSKDSIANAQPFAGKRMFSDARATVPAPDLTFKKLLDKGADLLRKYMPEAAGRRVLLSGSGWVEKSPSGKYEYYADVIG